MLSQNELILKLKLQKQIDLQIALEKSQQQDLMIFFIGKLIVKNSDVSDSKPVVKNSDVLDSKPVVLPQPLNTTSHLVFKPHLNYKQLGTVCRSNYLKQDLMIFHQNIYLFFTFHRSKLGYNNLKDIEIVILLNTADTI